MNPKETSKSFDVRDASTDFMLGGFLVVLSAPICIGILYSEKAIDRILNAGAGLIILLVGLAFVLRAVVLRRSREIVEPTVEGQARKSIR